MACEKCWGDAYMRMQMNGRPQSDNYRELLEERKGNPCTPEEQAGTMFRKQESGTDGKLPLEIVDLLTNVAQLLDVIKGEWGDEWSAWDQEQRDAITKHLMAYHYPDSGRSGDKQVLCAARHSNTGENYPQDCDWPFCGCDPKANKVIEAIEESSRGVVEAIRAEREKLS